jgi:hypothetical protein
MFIAQLPISDIFWTKMQPQMGKTSTSAIGCEGDYSTISFFLTLLFPSLSLTCIIYIPFDAGRANVVFCLLSSSSIIFFPAPSYIDIANGCENSFK